ncbi:MAG: RDD family protein [Bacteroidales bacterium]|nr:RDD family protein [Bacteroidales bacterium]HPD00093.1 RDD family protein [Acetivibrio sp.]
MQNQDCSSTTIYAGFAVRLMAFIIDSLLVGAALMIVRIPVFFISLIDPSNILKVPVLFKFSVYDIVLYLLGATYYVLMTYYCGFTLGKKLLNLKVVSDNEEGLTFINVLYRETIGKYLSAILFIGYLMIAVDSEKRGLHDRLCDTRVIYNFKIPVKVVTEEQPIN